MRAKQPVLRFDQIGAVVFDTEGVLIDTARVRAAAWKRSLDEFLRHQQRVTGRVLAPFDVRTDYVRYLGNGSRLEGVREFLAARGVAAGNGLGSEGGPGDVVRALADRQSGYFRQEIARYGVAAHPAMIVLVRDVRSRGAHTGAISPSRSGGPVLAAAQVRRLFDVRVDGSDAAHLGLARKPDPALLLEAARRLALAPARVAVLEYGIDGVEAARRGGFGIIVGVDRGEAPGFAERAATLRAHGAHGVVRDLTELVVAGRRRDLLTSTARSDATEPLSD